MSIKNKILDLYSEDMIQEKEEGEITQFQANFSDVHLCIEMAVNIFQTQESFRDDVAKESSDLLIFFNLPIIKEYNVELVKQSEEVTRWLWDTTFGVIAYTLTNPDAKILYDNKNSSIWDNIKFKLAKFYITKYGLNSEYQIFQESIVYFNKILNSC